MPSIINTNINSLSAQRNLGMSQSSQSTAIQRLSSGLRINSAKDDAAGLAISERFTSQVRGLDQAARNSNDGVSLAQTAEGALKSSGDMLQRIRELAVQSANATNSSSDRQAIQAEVGQLTSELDRIAQTTQFNGSNLLDGTFGTQQFQVGANANQTIIASTANVRTSNYGNNQNAAAAGAGVGAQAAATAAGTNGVASGAVSVTGYLGTGSITVAANDTAETTALALNAVSSQTGVSATARTEAHLTGFTAVGGYSLQLQSSGGTATQVSFSVDSATGSDRLSKAVQAINDQSSKTGITAGLNTAGTEVVLTNSTGKNINVALTAGTTNAGSVGVTAYNADGGTTGTARSLAASTASDSVVVTGGYIQLDSQKSFALTSVSTQLTTGSSSLHSVANLDVTTFANATDAIKTVDSALAYVNGQRANLGALQSRFQSAIGNLQVTSENMTASRSRIQDADFASETANLSRAQILQQAGTAMVAQANQLPQGVLSLLR